MCCDDLMTELGYPNQNFALDETNSGRPFPSKHGHTSAHELATSCSESSIIRKIRVDVGSDGQTSESIA